MFFVKGAATFADCSILKYHTRSISPIQNSHVMLIHQRFLLFPHFLFAERLVSVYLAMISRQCMFIRHFNFVGVRECESFSNDSTYLIKSEYKTNTYSTFKIHVSDSRLSFLSSCLPSMSIYTICAQGTYTNNYVSNCLRDLL